MKPTDLKILQHIRHNARTNLTTISRKTGIPVSTIFDRLRAQEGDFILKFTALLNFEKLGYPIRANIYLKVSPESRDAVKRYLSVHDRVNNLQRINNGFDFATECIFTSIREAEGFVEQLELQFKILEKQVFHIIDDISREKVLSDRLSFT
jgi:DNA-binding Lrp family transcriptional regulator